PTLFPYTTLFRSQLGDVQLDGPAEAPVLAGEPGDVARVDRIVIALRDRVVEQQGSDVDEVFAVDLVDLQLAEQEVRRAGARALVAEAPAKIDDVGHLEDVHEDVDLAPVVAV